MKEKTILFQYNVDTDGNPISIDIKENAQVSNLKNTIQLEQIPDEIYGVIVLDKDGNTMREVYNYDEIEEDESYFYVNYTTGIIYFNSNQGAEKKIINYYGTGVELISCKRVFDGYYNSNGQWVTQTLQDIIDAGREAIRLMTSVGDIATILQLLETKMAEGDLKIQEIQDIIDEANDLTKVTGNEEVIINTSDWIDNGNGGYYAIVNHNCNTESIHVTFKRTFTKENMILGYTIIDNNSFKVFNHENVTTSCIISAMYYRATQTISDDIAQEVVQARGGENTLCDRFNKMQLVSDEVYDARGTDLTLGNRLDKIELTAENGLSGVRDLQRDNYDIKQRVSALEVSGENPYVIDLRQETDYDPSNADVCLNRVLANVPENCTVVLNDGEITINSQVKITLGKGSKVFINACVKTTGHGFEIIGNYFNNNVYIKSIVGTNKNYYDGIILRNMYNGYISIDEISGFSRGINLQPTKNDGIQYCKIEWLSISNCSSCIVLDASLGSGGSCWVNENTFTGGRLSGDTGIYSMPTNSPAEYNNNKFYNVGFEGIANRCVLLNMSKSFSFDNPRMIEGFPSGLWIEELDGCSRNTYSIPYGIPVGKYKLGYSSNIKAPILDSTWANPISYHVQNTWDNSIDGYVDIYEKIPNCTYIREADFYNAGGTVTINSNSTTINITLDSTDRIIKIPDYLSYNGNTFLLSFIHSGAGKNGRLRVDHVDKSGTHTGMQFYGEGTYQLINHGGIWLCNKIDNGLVINS